MVEVRQVHATLPGGSSVWASGPQNNSRRRLQEESHMGYKRHVRKGIQCYAMGP